MAELKGIVVNADNGGIGGVLPNQDGVSALIMGAPADSGVDLDTVFRFIQTSDAEAEGITASFDSANKVKLHWHIAEFFRMNPEGILYVLLKDNDGLVMANLVQGIPTVIKSQVAIDNGEDVKLFGTVLNPLEAYEPNILNGLEDVVMAAVTEVATVNTALEQELRWFDACLIEGRGLADALGAIKNFRLDSSWLASVVIAQDGNKAAEEELFEKTAEVGTVLGRLSLLMVQENLGNIIARRPPSKYVSQQGRVPLEDKGANIFMDVRLSNNIPVMEISAADMAALYSKGYIVAGTRPSYPGVYLNDSATAVPLTSDFSYIERNRVINKAKRSAVKTFTPKINAEVPVNPANGRIQTQVCKEWEALGRKEILEPMIAAGEISGGSIFIDPNQNILVDSKVTIRIRIVPVGIAREIEVAIGFTTQV